MDIDFYEFVFLESLFVLCTCHKTHGDIFHIACAKYVFVLVLPSEKLECEMFQSQNQDNFSPVQIFHNFANFAADCKRTMNGVITWQSMDTS